MSTKQKRTAESHVNLQRRLGYEAQIEALTAPGLTPEQRVRAFAKEARFTGEQLADALWRLRSGCSPTCAVWWPSALAPLSLFANLPDGCGCPATAVRYDGADLPGIPPLIGRDYEIDRPTGQAFARVQLDAWARHEGRPTA